MSNLRDFGTDDGRSEFLDPWSQLHLPAPGAARLAENVNVALGNRVRIEQAVGIVGRGRPALAADAAVNNEMRDVNAERTELAGHALRKPAQRELTHGERRRVRIALYARRGAGEQDRALPTRHHQLGRSLPDQKSGERRYAQRFLDLVRLELDQRPARAVAGVVDHDVRLTDLRFNAGEQLVDVVSLRGVAGEQNCAGLARERPEILGRA